MIPMTLCVDGEEKTYEGTMCGKRHIPNFPTNPLVKPLLKAVVNGENALMTTDCVEVAPCGAVAVVCEATVCNTVVACDNE